MQYWFPLLTNQTDIIFSISFGFVLLKSSTRIYVENMYPNIISKILFNSIQIEQTKHLLLEPWKFQIDTKCNIDLSLVLKP